MTAALQHSTVVARLSAGEAAARHIADMLAETLDPLAAVPSAFEDTGGRWTVAIHFSDPPNETAVRALVALVADAETANALAFERLAGADWVATGLAGLTPVAAGRFVVHGAHDRARVAANRIGIEIEAALAFGTGHHGTTRGCLIALDRIAKTRKLRKPRKILDVGSGTGVLAIAAARALRVPVLASDIDVRAVRTARANARRNRAGAIVFVHAAGLGAGAIRRRARFDLVLANILLAPLVRLARPMARLVAPNAQVVLSGLLREQENAALAAYRAQGLRLVRRIRLDEWVTLVLRRGIRVCT